MWVWSELGRKSGKFVVRLYSNDLRLFRFFSKAHLLFCSGFSLRTNAHSLPFSRTLSSNIRTFFLFKSKKQSFSSKGSVLGSSEVKSTPGGEVESLEADATYQEFSWSSVVPRVKCPFLLSFDGFVFPALGGLLFGYDIGATSGATISLQSAELSGTTWFNLSAIQLGLVIFWVHPSR